MLPPRRDHISRLEAFSDVVFAFALTLLVVALEVPKSYAQLMVLLGGFLSRFPAASRCSCWIWYEHNMFFRRYGPTVALNAGLLFVVLFYVYPLKFMFDSMFERLIPALRGSVQPMTLPQLGRAATVYALDSSLAHVLRADVACSLDLQRADPPPARGARRLEASSPRATV